MRNASLHHLGLSPAQKSASDAIVERVRTTSAGGRGHVLFIPARPGSGKTFLLQALAERLEASTKDVRIAMGGLANTSSPSRSPDWVQATESLLINAASAASVFDPSLTLIGPLIGLSSAAAGLAQMAISANLEPTELLTRMLRAAAREEPAKPLVCLVDDADALAGTWWTELQFSFAREITEDLRMIIVLAVEEDGASSVRSQAAPPPSERAADSLIARDLAERIALEALSAGKVAEWLGPAAPREATKAVFELTGGLTGEVVEMWRQWLDVGTLTGSGAGDWHLVDEKRLLDDAATQLACSVDEALPSADPSEVEVAREVLGIGALEGRTFTAAAVAFALQRDLDTVEDLLDVLAVEPPGWGLLRPPRQMEVRDSLRETRGVLWRYEFTTGVMWRAARDRLLDWQVQESAERLLAGLSQAYGQATPAIAPTLARLAELARQPSLAQGYRELVIAPSQAALEAQARYLLIADQEGWREADHRDASYVLARATLDLSNIRPSSSLWPFANRAVQHAERATAQGARPLAFALRARARILHRSGDIDGAETVLEEARELVAEGEPELRAGLSHELFEVLSSRYERSQRERELVEEARTLFRRGKNARGEAICKYDLSQIATRAGEIEKARRLNEEVLEFMRANNERRQEMAAHLQRALIELADGNYNLAREYLQEPLRYHSAVGRTISEAACLRVLASIELRLGSFQSSKSKAAAALELYRRIEDRDAEGPALYALADACRALGERELAHKLFLEAHTIFEEVGDAYHRGHIEQSLRALEAADAQ